MSSAVSRLMILLNASVANSNDRESGSILFACMLKINHNSVMLVTKSWKMTLLNASFRSRQNDNGLIV